MTDKTEVKITVFSDYICPFCYIAHHRLMQLKDEFDLRINWCFLEIHPETPKKGKPTGELGYSPEYWDMLMSNLKQLATEDSTPMAEHDFTTNSHDALLLAEASKQAGREIFYRLHKKLFSAFLLKK